MNIALTSYLAMNFTGCTTYTSLSGVLKEMKIALPLQITIAALGIIFWIIARFVSSQITF
jgi:acetyl-CoA decarbonylase/synthase complex subunit gamma